MDNKKGDKIQRRFFTMERKTIRTKRRYDRIAKVFNRMDHMIPTFWRKELLKDLKGEILEVGVGTGANLPYYPKSAKVIGIDFSPKMLEKAQERAKYARATIKLKEMDIQQMVFIDHTFDFVVSTCVFCSVPDPVLGLKEIQRVIKPEGKIMMLEHMRSENTFLGKIMDMINPMAVRMSGANVNRKTIENIEKAGLEIEQQIFLIGSIMRKLILIPRK